MPGYLNAACCAIHSNFDFGYGDLGSALQCPYGIESAIHCAMEATGDYRVQGVLARTVAEIIAEANSQCQLVRDMFDPFHVFQAIDPVIRAWDGGIIGKLAEAAYQERTLPSGELEQARLAVLADALEEGGYLDEELLDHLRETGVHVRGCFAIDFLRGKS